MNSMQIFTNRNSASRSCRLIIFCCTKFLCECVDLSGLHRLVFGRSTVQSDSQFVFKNAIDIKVPLNNLELTEEEASSAVLVIGHVLL